MDADFVLFYLLSKSICVAEKEVVVVVLLLLRVYEQEFLFEQIGWSFYCFLGESIGAEAEFLMAAGLAIVVLRGYLVRLIKRLKIYHFVPCQACHSSPPH